MQYSGFYLLLVLASLVVGDPLNSDGKAACLGEHNTYRQQLATGIVKNKAGQAMPKAANMNEILYTEALEAKAHEWAAKCVKDHEPNTHYGQNLFAATAHLEHSEAMKQATSSWWSEAKLYPNTDLTLTDELFNHGVGHFTQMAQGKNTKVGCAVIYCKGTGTLVFCNYERANIINEPIYEAGDECSKCEEGRTCSNGLCK
ncbi:putative effector protein [Aphelenchoides fujianensis]|nr:putative effector protein [Aphelenchoides fujianensis]